MRPVSEMIFHEVDRLAGVEKMGRNRMAHEMNMAVGRREIGERGVAAEQGLDLTYPETALAADEESRIVIAARGKVVAEWRHEASEKRLLAGDAVLRAKNPDLLPFQVEVARSSEEASETRSP